MVTTQSVPEQIWEQIGREFATIARSVVLLFFGGLLMAIGIVLGFSSVFGEGLNRYPLHVVLWIDLGFVLLVAVLSAIAEPAKSEARSWALASFVIAVGTLGTLGSHTGKVGQGLFDAQKPGIQDTTILSEIVCAYFGQESCGPIYFGIALTITLFACFLAAGSALMVRKRASQQETQSDADRAYYIFVVAAFLFGLHTIINQKWEHCGSAPTSHYVGSHPVAGAHHFNHAWLLLPRWQSPRRRDNGDTHNRLPPRYRPISPHATTGSTSSSIGAHLPACYGHPRIERADRTDCAPDIVENRGTLVARQR